MNKFDKEKALKFLEALKVFDLSEEFTSFHKDLINAMANEVKFNKDGELTAYITALPSYKRYKEFLESNLDKKLK